MLHVVLRLAFSVSLAFGFAASSVWVCGIIHVALWVCGIIHVALWVCGIIHVALGAPFPHRGTYYPIV